MLIYLFTILGVGLLSKKSSNEDDYLFASRKLTLPAFIATFVTTWYGGILEIGRFTFENGIITWIIFGFFYYIAALLLLVFIAPKIHKNSINTIPGYFHINFGYIPGIISSIIILLLSSPAPYLMIFATIFNHVYDINYIYSIFIGLFFSVSYIMLGGFKSIIRTDKIQFILMYVGFIIILIKLYTDFGGISFLINNAPQGHLELSNKLPIGYLISWLFISMITFIDPNIFHRVYSAKNKKILSKGILYSIVFWMIFDFLTISTGLYASAIIKSSDITSSPYLMLSDMVLPPYLQVFFIISLLSIVMSTIDSFTFTSAITIGNEIKNNKSIKFNARIGLLITSIIAVVICISFNKVIDIWYVFGSIGASSLLIPLIKIIFNPNYRIAYPALTLIIPAAIASGWIYLGYPYNIDPIFPGMLSSFILNKTIHKLS